MYNAEKQRLFGPDAVVAFSLAVLVGIKIVKILWRLYQCDVFITEVTDGVIDEIRVWRVVAVEDGDEFAIRVLQRIIKVTGLGMFVIGTCDVFDLKVVRELFHLLTVTIVEQPDLTVVTHAFCCQQCAT